MSSGTRSYSRFRERKGRDQQDRDVLAHVETLFWWFTKLDEIDYSCRNESADVPCLVFSKFIEWKLSGRQVLIIGALSEGVRK